MTVPARVVCRLGITVGLLGWAAVSAAEPDDAAYALNRDGMIAMSEARFEDAIVAFQRAAALRDDYAITGRALIYTPSFMTGWALEKIGRTEPACRGYRRFLDLAQTEIAESTKIDHAADYIETHCKSPVEMPADR